jgi:hypothetical protein
MLFSRIAPLFLASLAPLAAANLPVVPRSDRVLTVQQVKHFWSRSIRSQPLPSPRLHPDHQAAHRAEVRRRQVLLERIRAGDHDIAARLVCLSHNVEAWSRLGEPEKSRAEEERLIRLREHLARLAALEAQQRAAEKSGEAAERLARLAAEIRELRARLSGAA